MKPRICVAMLVAAGCLAGQSVRPEDMAKDLAQGKMLVAPRGSPDPVFGGTVILLVKYGESGAVGLVLNRQTDIPVSRALRGVKGAAGHAEPVWAGGPVQMETVMAVSKSAVKPEGSSDVFGSLHLLAAKTALEKALAAPANPAALRVYLGYCGWAPHQLESEVRRKGWLVFDRNEALAFDAKPETLWSRLVSRTESKMARVEFRGPEDGEWRLRARYR